MINLPYIQRSYQNKISMLNLTKMNPKIELLELALQFKGIFEVI